MHMERSVGVQEAVQPRAQPLALKAPRLLLLRTGGGLVERAREERRSNGAVCHSTSMNLAMI